jgi:tetratricopeptide (TPR) repeat protein
MMKDWKKGFLMFFKSKLLVLAFVCLLMPSHYLMAQQGQAQLTVQAARQANYSRLVLDVPETTDYTLSVAGRTLTISIVGNFNVDMSGLEAVTLPQVGSATARRVSGNTVIAFEVLPGVNPSDFRSGGYVVIDVYGGDQNAQLRRTSPTIPSEAQENQTADNAANPTNGQSDAQSEAEAAATDDNEPNTPLTTIVGSNAPVEPENENDLSGNIQPLTAGDTLERRSNTDDDAEPLEEQNTADGYEETGESDDPNQTVDIDSGVREAVSAIEFGSLEAIQDDANVVTVATETFEDNIKVSFTVPSEAGFAVFQRGALLWAVFDRPFTFNPEGFRVGGREVSRRIRRVEQLSNEDALILRMNVRSGQNMVVEREGNVWELFLKDTPANPRFPLRPTRREDEIQGQLIFIQASDIGRKIEVEDPDIGDLLVIMPMLRQSTGVAQKYSYAAAELLETAQGIVVSPLSDNIMVERFRDGVAIRAVGNSLLSSSKLSRATGIGDSVADGFARLIDFDNWRIGASWEYRKNKARLLYELSLSEMENANDVRWKLARYYLAHGRAAEALGILKMMLKQDELLEQNSEFRAVRGVANFKQGRLDEAAVDLSVPELSAEQDAELWRAMVAEARGKYENALEFYRRGKDVMGTYDENDRAELQLAVIRSAIETGELEMAQQELDLMSGLTLTEAQLSESVYQSARIAEKQGQFDQALTQYDDLTRAPERWISARARYSRVKFGLRSGDIDPASAIDQLERLRYAWRGDRFESILLSDLSDLYFATGDFEMALEALRQGVSYYPDAASNMQMSSRMGNIFRALFEDGRADELTPIGAISLFYKFRELTPLGNEGDLMIRRLADRLVSVDLLDRAAELLEYQVKSRTEGAARAQIAGNLAKIYILNREPDKALEILRATREPRLPGDILANRRHIEARTLIEMNKFEEAEVLIEDDRSADAEVLRADAYWGSKDWIRLVPTIRRLLGDGWRRNSPISGIQRLNLIRLAIALSQTGDRAGLIELRRRYSNQVREGDFARAFELLTNDQDLSGRELGDIAAQIASVEKFQSFMQDYRSEFSSR